MNRTYEKPVEVYCKKYKNGVFGKQYSIELFVYSSHIEGEAFEVYEEKISNETFAFEISYETIKGIYIGEIKGEKNITIEYKRNSVVKDGTAKIALMGVEEPQKWIDIIETAKEKYIDKQIKRKKLEIEAEEKKRQLDVQRETSAADFYRGCYDHYIKETTPVYQLFADNNKSVVLFIDENKGLNFLKIDGYTEEENRGIINYNSIHYYEKAGNIHYTTDIHGNYSSFGGSMTGANFSKLASVGGGLLFGLMGMAAGAALTYKPAEYKPAETNFTIDSDIKTIDDRNVILNFYSDSKGQYVDIELPYDIYNFLSTYLPEKKYNIVEELEKRTAVHQSAQIIERGDLLNASVLQDKQKGIEMQSEDNDALFAQKIKKLKMMKDAGLLSEEEFDNKRKELLDMI